MERRLLPGARVAALGGLVLGSAACSEIIDADRYSVAAGREVEMNQPVGMGGAGGAIGPINPTTGTGGGATGPTPVVGVTPGEGQPPAIANCTTNPSAPACRAVAPQPSGDAALARAAAVQVLRANCSQCHGPALTPAQAQAGMNYIEDIDALVETGKIVPLNSAGSRLVQRMRRGEMPPVTSGLPQVSTADINLVAQFIDNPAYWPTVVPPAACEASPVDFDTLFRLVNTDLASAVADDRPFYRYVSLTNRVSAGVCPDALAVDRQGLIKMLNMLSIDAAIGLPDPINAEQTVYRIDLRDFDWDRALSVDGKNFEDVWEGIVAANPYAVEWVGVGADRAKLDTGSAFPLMFADQMLDVAVIGNLYYAIIGVDVNDTLSAFIANDLQIDLTQNLLDETSVRAGTSKSRISRQDQLAQRDDIQIRQGALWQVFDVDDSVGTSIFEDPFGFPQQGGEAIFTLPNGMLAFVIADATDAIVEDSPILIDTTQNNFRAVSSVSCSNCHSAGLIPLVDEVRELALANALAIGLDSNEVAQLEGIYVSPQEFARITQADSQTFYQRALQLAALPITGGDPVSSVFFRFDQDLKLADAAGDLGVTSDTLRNDLAGLNPVLGVLAGGGVLDRDDFTSAFIDSLCRLSAPLENRPAVAVCTAAAAAAP